MNKEARAKSHPGFFIGINKVILHNLWVFNVTDEK
jgi:hypothetical protein